MNPWISSGLATMVEFWDAGMCCWPVWDHIWIVWLFDFFGCVFFFCGLGISTNCFDRWMPVEKELFVISTVWCSNITLHPWNPLTIDSLTPRKKSSRPVSRLALGVGFMARTWSYGVIPSGLGKKTVFFLHDLSVSKNRGTPKWMVYNGKPY